MSRFAVSHGLMLNVFTRPDGCSAMKRLIRASHETPVRQRQHGRHALAILRSLGMEYETAQTQAALLAIENDTL